jgi:uncharacterized protein (TIGR00725 family)
MKREIFTISAIGPGQSATKHHTDTAEAIGAGIAFRLRGESRVIFQTGGLTGVMESFLRGTTLRNHPNIRRAFLPTNNKKDANEYANDVIVSGLAGSARNFGLVMSSDIILCCGDPEKTGTVSEIAFAAINKIKTILVFPKENTVKYWSGFGDHIVICNSVDEAVEFAVEAFCEHITANPVSVGDN